MLNAGWAHFNNHAANQFGRSPPVALRPRRLRTSRKSDICRCPLPHLDEARSVYLLCDTCVRRHTRDSVLHHQRFRIYTSNEPPGVIVQSEEYSPRLGEACTLPPKGSLSILPDTRLLATSNRWLRTLMQPLPPSTRRSQAAISLVMASDEDMRRMPSHTNCIRVLAGEPH